MVLYCWNTKVEKMEKVIILLVFLGFSFSGMAQNTFEMEEGDTTYLMKEYYLCLLYRGDKALDRADLETIQAEHLAHINKLADEGKVTMAGPISGNEELRGILIFHTKSKEEAEALQGQDPAIKSGRLRMEIYPWWAAQGSKLP